MKDSKKNIDDKGFSLVELIVTVSIMIILISVLGSVILGYVEKSRYSKDVYALDSIKTACVAFAGDTLTNYVNNHEYTLAEIMGDTAPAGQSDVCDPGGIVESMLKEVFTKGEGDWTFNSVSKAFADLKASKVLICVDEGSVSIKIDSKDPDFKGYSMGVHTFTRTID